MDYAAQLDEVNAAISAVLQAQAYSFRGRSVTRASLTELRAMRNELDRIVNGTSSRMGASVIQVNRPT